MKLWTAKSFSPTIHTEPCTPEGCDMTVEKQHNQLTVKGTSKALVSGRQQSSLMGTCHST